MLLPSGNPFKYHEEVLYFQLLLVLVSTAAVGLSWRFFAALMMMSIAPATFTLYCRYFVLVLTVAGRPGSSEVPRNPLTRWDVSSTPANGIFLTKKIKIKILKKKCPTGGERLNR